MSAVKLTAELLAAIPRKCRSVFLLNLFYQDFVRLCNAARAIYETDSTDVLAWRNLASNSNLYAAVYMGDFGLPSPVTLGQRGDNASLPERTVAEWMGAYTPKCIEALFGSDAVENGTGPQFFSVLLTEDDPVHNLSWWERALASGTISDGHRRLRPHWSGHNQLHFYLDDRVSPEGVKVNYRRPTSRARLLLFSAPSNGSSGHDDDDAADGGICSTGITVLADTGAFVWSHCIAISSLGNTDTVSLDVPLGSVSSVALRVSLSTSNLSGDTHSWRQRSIEVMDPSRLRLDRLVRKVAERIRRGSHHACEQLTPHLLETFHEEIRALKLRAVSQGSACSDIRGHSEFPLEITLTNDGQQGLPDAVLNGLLSEEFAADTRPSSFVAARFHPDVDPTGEMQLCWHGGSCVLSNYRTGRRLCEHSMPYPVLVRWIQSERGERAHMCPDCNHMGKQLADMEADSAVPLDNLCLDSELLKSNSMRRYLELRHGRNFAVIEWQGCNQQDVTVYLYQFGHAEQVRGFVRRMNSGSGSGSGISPDAAKISCSMVNGMERADREQTLWCSKFPHVVMYSTGE